MPRLSAAPTRGLLVFAFALLERPTLNAPDRLDDTGRQRPSVAL